MIQKKYGVTAEWFKLSFLSLFFFPARLIKFGWNLLRLLNFPGGSDRKASAYNAGDPGSIPGLGRSREGNGNTLQYSCLENPMDGGTW